MAKQRRQRVRLVSPFRRAWEVLCLVVSILTLRNSFLPPEQRSPIVTTLEALWFMADIALNFKTEMLLRDGSIVTDVDTVGRIYMRLWFWVDVVLALPWEGVITMLTLPAAQPRKGGFLRRVVVGSVQWVGRRVGKVKDAIGSRIPRALRPSSIRRFLRLTETLDVPRVEGVKTVVKHKKWIRRIAKAIRFLLRYLRFTVLSFLHRCWSKIRLHLGQQWSPWVMVMEEGGGGSSSPHGGGTTTRSNSRDSGSGASGGGKIMEHHHHTHMSGFQRWIRGGGGGGRRRLVGLGGIVTRRRAPPSSSSSSPSSSSPPSPSASSSSSSIVKLTE